MIPSQHYTNAPITEAIIDLRVVLPETVTPDDLRQSFVHSEANYPRSEEIIEAVGQMAVGRAGGSASVQQSLIGWKFGSANQKTVVQSRVNGFTFSRLAPYERWDTFRDEARGLWTSFRDLASPTEIVRVAVRYINRLDIPGDRNQVDLKTYLRTSPEIAPELPQQLEGYFMQLRVGLPDIASHCWINQTIVPPPREGLVSVVLDIDLYRVDDIPRDDDALWSLFELLHDEKNRVFEACITDSTRRLIS